MNQIPNIEEAVDKFIKDNGIVLLADYTKGDVIGLQSIRTEIENPLHHQLQKAREEEREKIFEAIDDFFIGPNIILDGGVLKGYIREAIHSELDQDKK